MESTLPMLNMRYLLFLKKIGIKPKYFYDIGSSNQCWSKVMKSIFPELRCYTFDAHKPFNAEFPICLSNVDNLDVKFYNHNEHIKSIYTLNEEVCDKYEILYTIKLDTFVKEQSLETPDIVKINCCGAEKNIIEGGIETIKNAKYLIVTLMNYGIFDDAPTAKITGPYIEELGFEMINALDNNGLGLIDYVFKNKNI
jgi:FkbM family methyltransferase